MKQSFLCSPDFYLYSCTAFMLRIIFHKTIVTSLLNFIYAILCVILTVSVYSNTSIWINLNFLGVSYNKFHCRLGLDIEYHLMIVFDIIYRMYIYNGDYSLETFICSSLFGMKNIKQGMGVSFFLMIWGLKKNSPFYCFATSLVMWQDTSDVNVNYFYLRK